MPNENFIIKEKLYSKDLIVNGNYQYIIPIIISPFCPSNKFYDETVSYCHSCEIGDYFKNNNCIKCSIPLHCSDNAISEYFIYNEKNILTCDPFKESCL